MSLTDSMIISTFLKILEDIVIQRRVRLIKFKIFDITLPVWFLMSDFSRQ